MKDKFVLNFRQVPNKERPTAGEKHGGNTGVRGPSAQRRQNLLHDHRTKDSLVEYLDDLESE